MAAKHFGRSKNPPSLNPVINKEVRYSITSYEYNDILFWSCQIDNGDGTNTYKLLLGFETEEEALAAGKEYYRDWKEKREKTLDKPPGL